MQKGLMTEGNIYRHIILFSIPLLLGNIFQLLYNTVDSIVVGRYVGKSALAAVGASTPLINLLVAFFMGLSVGAGVIIGRFFGGNKDKEVSLSVHTFVLMALIFGVVLSVVGLVFSEQILNLMSTPEDVIVEAGKYLKIYFLGSIFVCLYNGGTGILQAVGDSQKPLYFLGLSSIVNIGLDLYFVRNLHMGVSGAAIATLISQAIACFLVLFVLLKSKASYRLNLFQLKFDFKILSEIIKIGIPAGLQGMIVSLSNVVVQSYINGFGSGAIAGFSSANKFDNFLGMPVNSFSLAITTFSSQNLGANKLDRVKKGVSATLFLSIATVVSLGILVFIFSRNCIAIFSDDVEVINYGSVLIRIMCPFYTSLCLHQIYSGAIRAKGHSSIPMFISVFCFVVIRQIFLAAFINIYHSINLIGIGYSFTWTLAGLISLLYYKKVML